MTAGFKTARRSKRSFFGANASTIATSRNRFSQAKYRMRSSLGLESFATLSSTMTCCLLSSRSRLDILKRLDLYLTYTPPRRYPRPGEQVVQKVAAYLRGRLREIHEDEFPPVAGEFGDAPDKAGAAYPVLSHHDHVVAPLQRPPDLPCLFLTAHEEHLPSPSMDHSGQEVLQGQAPGVFLTSSSRGMDANCATTE